MTQICIPIFLKGTADQLEESIDQAQNALAAPVTQDSGLRTQDSNSGMIELRADTASPKQLLAALDLVHVPVIVTVRPTWEGGFSTKSEPERLKLWEAAIEAGADYLDIELVAWEKSKTIRETLADMAEKHGTRLILSSHHFEGRPKDLADRLARLRKIKPAHILKLAWKAQSILDAIDALRLTQNSELRTQDSRPVVALAMGEEGYISRLLARKFNAPFTFATTEAGNESAPGQPTVSDLINIYRWNQQQSHTPVFGVVGWPVGHSLSPHIHNAGFDALNLPGVYIPLAIKPDYDSFRIAIETLRTTPTMNLRGLSVTIPHKENALRYIKEHGGTIDELSTKIGVINTLIFPSIEKQKSKIKNGLNTDYTGALDALVTAWSNKRDDVKNKRIAVLGAGGAARAIVAGLAAHGAHVTIYNRTLEKAQSLANEFPNTIAAPIDQLAATPCDAYINCTPLGMHPKTNASPLDNLPEIPFPKDTVVFDTVYNPRLTKFLKQAQKLGAKIITGDEMFIRQAALQFQEFTGKPAPLEIFRQVLAQALGAMDKKQ